MIFLTDYSEKIFCSVSYSKQRRDPCTQRVLVDRVGSAGVVEGECGVG